MPKTPDEIKKGLRIHRNGCKRECPYWDNCSIDDHSEIASDALAYIQQLEADNAKKDETIQMLQDGNASLMRMIDEECETSAKFEVERDELKDALCVMVYQYCVSGDKLDHKFMCAGEVAFQALGLEQGEDVKRLEEWVFPEPPKEELL